MKRYVVLVVLMVSVLPGCSSQQAQPDKPHILFLIADDQRADALGVAGNEHIQTPHLDALARSGVRFTNTYCMGGHHGAICAPSRAMLMSGKSLFNVYDRLNGVATMPRTFRDHGYLTFGTGKWHNEHEAFASSFEIGRKVMLGGMSDHFNVPVRDRLTDSTFTDSELQAFSTDLFADETIDFINTYAAGDDERPFFAYVSFTAPHDPRSPSSDYIGRYPDGSIPPPANFMPQHPFDNGNLIVRDEDLGPWPRTEEDISKQLSDYYGLITHIDARVGDILAALDANGLRDNTLVVYTADHGLAVGSHGLLGKQNLYEHSMKAPLIIAGPGLPENQVRDALVYLYDLFPTLSTYAGVPLPDGVEGEDLMPVIKGEEPGVRESIFLAYRDIQRAVRDQQWKLIRYPKIDHTQLFDLENDPHELTNLAEEPAHAETVTEMMALLQEWQQAKRDTVALTAAEIQPKEYTLSDYLRVSDPHQPEYTRARFFEDVMADPLRLMHYQILRAAWYEKKTVTIRRNYDTLYREAQQNVAQRDALFEILQDAQRAGIVQDLPDRATFDQWFLE